MENVVKNNSQLTDQITNWGEGDCYNHSGAMWLILNGKKCSFQDGTTYEQLCHGESTPTPGNFDEIPQGPAISQGACFVQGYGASEVYLINNGKKHHLKYWQNNFSSFNLRQIYPYILECIETGHEV